MFSDKCRAIVMVWAQLIPLRIVVLLLLQSSTARIDSANSFQVFLCVQGILKVSLKRSHGLLRPTNDFLERINLLCASEVVQRKHDYIDGRSAQQGWRTPRVALRTNIQHHHLSEDLEGQWQSIKKCLTPVGPKHNEQSSHAAMLPTPIPIHRRTTSQKTIGQALGQ